MLLASLSPTLTNVPNLCYHALPTTKASIYEFLTGRYSSPHTSEVTWDWTEPQTVGKTMTFGARFFQKSGAPYPVSDGDGILIEILHEGVKVARTLEFSGNSPTDVNLVRCSFTVHKSGTYKISIMVGGRHIRDSPFIKSFDPGPIDPSKTGFMHYTSTVVFPSGSKHPLVIETRDSFGNLAPYRADHKAFFKIKVTAAGTKERYNPTTQIIYNTQDKKLVMYIKIDQKGCYQAVVSYGDVKLKNGEFDILVLETGEYNKVIKNVYKQKSSVWHMARLLSLNGEKLEKPKKVFVYISPKQMTIKEFCFKIYRRKLCTFRVCPWTKFIFNGVSNQFDAPTFVIEDGSQQSVELAAQDRNIIAATFSSFLLKSIGGSETFNDKRDFFNREIQSFHDRRSHNTLLLKIERSSLLSSSYKVTKPLSVNDWCRRFEISFIGEQGLDWGGLSREWFELLGKELFDPNCSQLFTRFTDNPQGLVHPNPKRPPDKKVKLYEFAGKIVGKCLIESAAKRTQLVKAKFTRSFLAQLIGLRVTYKHFETDDPEFFTTKISYIENNDVDDMELTFAEEVYDTQGQLVKVVDLIPNGSKIAVTNSNKLRYLDALAQHRLVTPVKDEVESFMKGLSSELIPENLLSIFDENELELLMCGTGTYSIADFKLYHNVVGATASFNRVLDWFWTIIASFTEEQMARLLQFITGSSQLPPGGFSELVPKIQLSSAPTYNSLPSSHTCFNQLCLPDYDNMETFHHMLLIAINEGNQGFGLV
ncbi:apoptosis-resistant E3 ubiquitin protein ligase 1-like [Physella acuta]|uniref:apoptosis-resistant E3 ubiquitin protein ligase 1-like n=1 Tax=Physella acuta TaxID=109671 RepID=UPI0027DAFD11|nr:apoptosis-resistant E3 ubiquitin protein ligase 1-like [Physella acuta]